MYFLTKKNPYRRSLSLRRYTYKEFLNPYDYNNYYIATPATIAVYIFTTSQLFNFRLDKLYYNLAHNYCNHII